MHLTAAQQKAIIVFLAFLQAIIIYHWMDNWLYPRDKADFSTFEAAFQERADSLEKAHRHTSSVKDASATRIAAIGQPEQQSKKLQQQSGVQQLVNINTAAAEELATLPRIGPKTAARIIAYREEHGPFKAKVELTKVRGIGPKTLEKLRPLIRVD